MILDSELGVPLGQVLDDREHLLNRAPRRSIGDPGEIKFRQEGGFTLALLPAQAS